MSISTARARLARGARTDGRSPEELREIVSHWGAELELAPAEVIVEWAAATFGERFCITSSMGDAVLAHLASKVVPGVDVVFLDYTMPGLNGLATLGELKRAKPDVDVIIMTSAQDLAIADRALRAGASAFLQKPFYPADIDAVLYSRYGLMPCARRD